MLAKNTRPTFGPWSTALHDDLGEHLNTFWRRRLNALPRVARTMPRLSRRIVFSLGLVAIAVSLVPTMRFTEAIAKEDKSTLADNSANAPFTYKFSNGAEVELIGLSKNPSKDEPWWRPDGSPLEDRPFQDVRALMKSGLPREICFRWKNLPANLNETSYGWQIPDIGAYGGLPFDEQGKRASDLEGKAFSLETDDKTCTVTFYCSVDASSWKTEFKRSATSKSSAISKKGKSAVFGPVFVDNESTATVVSYQIPGKSVRLIGISHDGAELTASDQSGGSTGDVTQKTFYFKNSRPEDFERFELQTQTRTIEKVEFRYVSLHPDETTQIEIATVDAESNTPAKPVGIPGPPHLPGPFNKVAFPMEHSLSADRYIVSANYNKVLSERIDELCKSLATSSGTKLTAKGMLFYLPEDTDSSALQELRHLHKIDERPAWLRMWYRQGKLSVTNWQQGDITLANVLDNVIGIKTHRIEGDTKLLNEKFLGDWVFGRDPRLPHAVNPKEVAVVEAVLRDFLGHDVSLKLETVERPVYVARGDYRFRPIEAPDGTITQTSGNVGEIADGPFLFPSRKNDNLASVAQSFEQLLEIVGESISTPIVDETTSGPAKSNFFARFTHQFTGEATEERNKSLDEAIERGVVENFCKQTGLTLTKENREVQILTIKLN